VKLGPRTPEKALSVLTNSLKLHAKTRSIVDNSAVDYSISLKFCTRFKRITAEVLQKFKVKRSKVKVTA